MPLINIITSIDAIKEADELLQEISNELAELTGKPESYVMTSLQTNVPMTFSGTSEPCCYVEIKSIGAIEPAKMSGVFCKLISSKTGIPANRIYLGFEDVSANLWGWNGRTFG